MEFHDDVNYNKHHHDFRDVNDAECAIFDMYDKFSANVPKSTGKSRPMPRGYNSRPAPGTAKHSTQKSYLSSGPPPYDMAYTP